MSSIVIFRGVGDKKGQEIVDALLATTPAKLERGRVEMDENALPKQTVELDIVYRSGVCKGQLVEVHDSTQGASWRGKIVNIVHTVKGAKYLTRIGVVRHTEDF